MNKKGFAQIIHDVEKQFGTFQRSRAGRKDWIGIGGCKGQKNQNNETEQSPSHVNLADLAVVGIRFLLAIHSAWIQPKPTQISAPIR